jgi:hypothetical protein
MSAHLFAVFGLRTWTRSYYAAYGVLESMPGQRMGWTATGFWW